MLCMCVVYGMHVCHSVRICVCMYDSAYVCMYAVCVYHGCVGVSMCVLCMDPANSTASLTHIHLPQ